MMSRASTHSAPSALFSVHWLLWPYLPSCPTQASAQAPASSDSATSALFSVPWQVRPPPRTVSPVGYRLRLLVVPFPRP